MTSKALTVTASAMEKPPPLRISTPHSSLVCMVFQSNRAPEGKLPNGLAGITKRRSVQNMAAVTDLGFILLIDNNLAHPVMKCGSCKK